MTDETPTGLADVNVEISSVDPDGDNWVVLLTVGWVKMTLEQAEEFAALVQEEADKRFGSFTLAGNKQ